MKKTIEVFKTNVNHPDEARMIVDHIHINFRAYRANFDLEDCDRILRVRSLSGAVRSSHLLELLRDFGFDATVLGDEVPSRSDFLASGKDLALHGGRT